MRRHPSHPGRPSPCGRCRYAVCCGWAGQPIRGRPMVYTVGGSTCALSGRQPALSHRLALTLAAGSLAWMVRIAPGRVRSREPQRMAVTRTLDAAMRLARTADDVPAHDSPSFGHGSSLAHDTARTCSPPGRLGLHVTGRRPPVLTGTQPELRQLQPSPRPRRSHPCPLSTGERLGGVARRSDTAEKVAADFERLGTRHRKGESAVGVSTDSATPTIWLMSKPSMSARNSGLDRYASSRS